MTLEQYLKQHDQTPTEFARQHAFPPSTITRLLAGERAPGFELLTRIHVATGGAVTPNDFLPSGMALSDRAEQVSS